MVRQRTTCLQSPESCWRISVLPEERMTSAGRFGVAGKRKLAATQVTE